MQISDGKNQARKSLQNWIWEGLGLHLGGVWDGLGLFWRPLGGFLVVFLVFLIGLFSSIGLRWGPKGLLRRFGMDFGGFGGGFGQANTSIFQFLVVIWRCPF